MRFEQSGSANAVGARIRVEPSGSANALGARMRFEPSGSANAFWLMLWLRLKFWLKLEEGGVREGAGDGCPCVYAIDHCFARMRFA